MPRRIDRVIPMMRLVPRVAARLVLSALLLAVVACSDDQNGSGDANGTTDGNDGGGSDTGSDGQGADKHGGDIPICDEVVLDASPLANLLLVVDKSGSMNDPTSANLPRRTKVMDLRDAVHFLLDEFEGKIRFGWMAFPNQDKCDPGVVSVEVSNDSADLIRGLVDAFIAWGGTPTGESLQNADAYDGLQDDQRKNFVVLVTDGMPTCPNGGGAGQNQADSDLALSAVDSLHQHGIDTFVIGLGEDLNSANPTLLNDMAVAGGRPRADAVRYYPASSRDELEAAFSEIGKAVFDCSLALSVIPEKPDWIWVYLDGQPIDRNQTDGFDYDAANNRIDFYGPTCDRLRSGEVGTVEVKMGCAPPD